MSSGVEIERLASSMRRDLVRLSKEGNMAKPYLGPGDLKPAPKGRS